MPRHKEQPDVMVKGKLFYILGNKRMVHMKKFISLFIALLLLLLVLPSANGLAAPFEKKLLNSGIVRYMRRETTKNNVSKSLAFTKKSPMPAHQAA